MAHVGKLYKLQFRRDLSRVSNNAGGYPEAFRWGASNFTGAVADDFLNNVVPLINLAKDPQPPMQWQSDTRHIAGISYNARFVVDDPFNMPDSSLTFVVRDLTHSVDLFTFFSAANSYSGRPSGMSGLATTGFMDSPLFKNIAGSFLWAAAAMGWNTYNP